MSCGRCTRAVERATRGAPGVQAPRVDLQAGTLTAQGRVEATVIAAAVRAVGDEA